MFHRSVLAFTIILLLAAFIMLLNSVIQIVDDFASILYGVCFFLSNN